MAVKVHPHVNKLHHYCSMDTAVKIIENKTLRFSSIDSMNDTAENRYFLNVAMDNLHHIGTITPQQHEEIKNFLRPDGDVELAFSETFCFCLSCVADDLLQWRGYADDGYGAAISFSREGLRAFATNYEVSEPFPMLYEIEDIQKALKGLGIGIGESSANIVSAIHSFSLKHMAPRFKAHGFHAEREWRMIFSTENLPDLRLEHFQTMVRRKNIVPCYDFPFNPHIVDSIQVGPNVSKRTQAALSAVLARRGFPNVKVTHSEITYQSS